MDSLSKLQSEVSTECMNQLMTTNVCVMQSYL